ncbi:bucentaur or craniofacial development-domain-containing protein [Tricladium varicosporioides]|nr:bucentaur or craniofacial development-domain-containing protein [Hymenoscyphus varicosporioides]
MPPELIPSDEEYASEEDSDFAPDAVPTNDDDGAESSEDEADNGEKVKVAKVAPSTKRKRGQDDEAEDAGFENSGDEAIIEKGLKKAKRKKGKKLGDVDDEDGEGGLVKTRSMRAAEKTEKKMQLVDTSKATVDVDKLWADMISGKPPLAPPKPTSNDTATKPSDITESSTTSLPTTRNDNQDGEEDEMIMIKRSYNFAGKVHTEEKLVAKNSAEAKLYLSTQSSEALSKDKNPDSSTPFTKPLRPPKLARRSIFEPITNSLPVRTDLHFGVRKPDGSGLIATGKEKKLNTVDKSAMDWASFVDKEGIKDELVLAGKSKGAYRARQEFLARVEAKKEEDGRRARGLQPLASGGL